MNKRQLSIKNPCTQDWNTMQGGDRQRHCGVCDKPVHNLSAMTQGEAQAVLLKRSQGQRLCIRYSAGEDGKVLFQRQGLIPAGLLVRTRQVALRATLAAVTLASVIEAPGCVPAGPVTGAITARAAADQVAEQLGTAGTCAISLEPLLPLSLTLHTAACEAPGVEPVAAGVVQVPVVPVPPPAPAKTPPPPQQVAPPPVVEPVAAQGARQRPVLAKVSPKPERNPEIWMGEMM